MQRQRNYRNLTHWQVDSVRQLVRLVRSIGWVMVLIVTPLITVTNSSWAGDAAGNNIDGRGVKRQEAQSKQAQRKLALVIGNSNYAEKFLMNPVNDATDMAEKLNELGFDVISRTNLNKKAMKQVIREFVDRMAVNDVNLFYFAGHGVQVDGENYLIPIDIDFNLTKSELPDEAIKANTILNMMSEVANRTNIFILDACRDSPFRSMSRSSVISGLATLEGGVGTLIAYATAPGSVANDGYGRNGLYTQYLLKNIGTPGITVEQMFKRVRVDVLNATNNAQVPWENSSLRGDFCFAGCARESFGVSTSGENPPILEPSEPIKQAIPVNTPMVSP
jgi:Caspase domain